MVSLASTEAPVAARAAAVARLSSSFSYCSAEVSTVPSALRAEPSSVFSDLASYAAVVASTFSPASTEAPVAARAEAVAVCQAFLRTA